LPSAISADFQGENDVHTYVRSESGGRPDRKSAKSPWDVSNLWPEVAKEIELALVPKGAAPKGLESSPGFTLGQPKIGVSP
jgi:hypothetical protein